MKKKYPKLPRYISDKYAGHLEVYKHNLREDILLIDNINTEEPVIQAILSFLE
jgi:hypothetical protein